MACLAQLRYRAYNVVVHRLSLKHVPDDLHLQDCADVVMAFSREKLLGLTRQRTSSL